MLTSTIQYSFLLNFKCHEVHLFCLKRVVTPFSSKWEIGVLSPALYKHSAKGFPYSILAHVVWLAVDIQLSSFLRLHPFSSRLSY